MDSSACLALIFSAKGSLATCLHGASLPSRSDNFVEHKCRCFFDFSRNAKECHGDVTVHRALEITLDNDVTSECRDWWWRWESQGTVMEASQWALLTVWWSTVVIACVMLVAVGAFLCWRAWVMMPQLKASWSESSPDSSSWSRAWRSASVLWRPRFNELPEGVVDEDDENLWRPPYRNVHQNSQTGHHSLASTHQALWKPSLPISWGRPESPRTASTHAPF